DTVPPISQMTILSLLIALLTGVYGGIFDDYTLPGDEQYWASLGSTGTTTTAPSTSTSSTTLATTPESVLQQLLALNIPEYRGLPTTVEPLSVQERLQGLDIPPYHRISTAAPTESSPTPIADTTKSVLERLAELDIPLLEGISSLATASTSAPPPTNLRGVERTSFGDGISVSWMVVGVAWARVF
ncbi:hypothetical protein FOZ62_024134, partial [Perkinsus olseni]